MDDKQILVTGASGYIAMQTLIYLLDAGERVRGTLRSLDKADQVRDVLRTHTPLADMLELIEANLDDDEGWDAATEGCTHVLHIASPVPLIQPKDHDALIKPARDGALRVLQAAANAGVTRTVMTSSIASISYGWREEKPAIFTEEHWSNPDEMKGNTAYARSKTYAEKAAWAFVNSEAGKGMELAVMNPALVLGPALSEDMSASLEVTKSLLSGKMPGYPKISLSIIDVRDVAEAHIAALTHEKAAGERFILSNDAEWISDIGEKVRDALPDDYKGLIPNKTLPNWLVRLAAMFDPKLKQITPGLGDKRSFSNEKLRTVLGITPRPAEEAAIDSAQSLIDLGLVSPK